MSSTQPTESVRLKLIEALNGVNEELAKCCSAHTAVDSEETLRWMAAGLAAMLASLETGSRVKPPGFWHVISDGWPQANSLGDKIVDAELAYKRMP
jgi:hypothetical protein